jgi:AcrR family transcriptional regulator
MNVAVAIERSPREHIRRVALALFVEQGFQAVSLRQLASAAGMQAGSLYHHFESKQALLFELIESYETDLLRALPSGKSTDTTDPFKALVGFVRGYLQFSLRQALRARLTRLEFRCLQPEQQLCIRQLRRIGEQRLATILNHGIMLQVFKPLSVDTLVAGLLSLLNEAGAWSGPHLSTSAVIDLHMKMISGALLPTAG